MRRVLLSCIYLLLIGCTPKNTNPHLVLKFSGEEVVNIVDYEVYGDAFDGIYISLKDSVYKEVWDKNIKSIYFIKGNKRFNIICHNIMYSTKDVDSCQSPLTPKGKLAFFNICNTPMFAIDCRRNKDFIKEFDDVKLCDN